MTKSEFAQATRDLFAASKKDAPTNELLRDWWAKLENVPLKTLQKAYDAIIDLEAMPTLENVLMRCVEPKEVKHQKNKDNPQAMNLTLNGDGRDWARKILNDPKNREAIAIKNAKIALNIKA